MKGYQYLQNDFFELCRTRKVKSTAMLLYIYLRGLYCFFQKPIFFRQDREITRHLGITQKTLSNARQYLQERGLIKYTSGTGRTPTYYTMLGTCLLPSLANSTTQGSTPKHPQGSKIYDPKYKSYKRVNKKVVNRIGTTPRELLAKYKAEL